MAKIRASTIKQLREAKGWSQATLAEKAILDPKTLSKALNGNECQMKTVCKLAGTLGVDPGDILDGEDPSKASVPTSAQSIAAPNTDHQTVEVQLILRLPASTIDDAGSIAKLVQTIASLIDAKQPLITVSASAGSVILRLAMSEQDAISLVRAAMQRKLRAVKLLSLKVLDADFQLPDGLPHVVTPFTAPAEEAKTGRGGRRQLARDKKRKKNSKRKLDDQ